MIPTIEDLEKIKKCMDDANVPEEGRFMRFWCENREEVVEVEMSTYMSPKDILQAAFPHLDISTLKIIK